MRAVIFDFDGVLVDSEPLHFRSMRDSLLPEDVVIDEDEYARIYLAYDDRGAIRRALEEHDVAFEGGQVDRIARRKAALFEKMLSSIPFFPGVPELVPALAREMPLAIASGARRAEIETVLAAAGLRAFFGAVVGADDVAQGKPHPEPYLSAMERLAASAPGLRPEDCVVVEDSPPGIAAGLAAGMKVVAVSNSYPASKLTAAHRVVASLEGMSAADFRSVGRS
jgi:HAD superfamily hydrolase (TIGR01509 family)